MVSYMLDIGVGKCLRGVCMKISYKKLWMLLIQKDITKVQLRRDLGIAPGTMRVSSIREKKLPCRCFCVFVNTLIAILAIYARLSAPPKNRRKYEIHSNYH